MKRDDRTGASFKLLRHKCDHKKLEATLQVASSSTLLRSSAPQVGLEPTTLRLTAECSAIELLRNKRPHTVT